MSTNISSRLLASARITPIATENQTVNVRKLADGSLRVTQRNGKEFDVTDEAMQAFVIYTVLNSACNAGSAA